MKYDFRKSFDISYSRCDRWLNLSLVDAVLIAQEMNTDYFRSIESDNLTVKTRNDALWVLAKTRLHFFSAPKWGDTVDARSYTLKSRGFSTEIESVFKKQGSEDPSFIARQELCVIDATKREPRRIETISYPKDMEVENEAFLMRFFRLKEEFDKSNLVYSDSFRLTDIDFSNHVNNVAYVRYIVNALNKDFFEKNAVSDFEIQYRHECFEGHGLEVYKKDVDDHTMDFRITSDGNTAVDARIVYEPTC